MDADTAATRVANLDQLKRLPHWVAYDDNKVPIDPHTGKPASTTRPRTWGTAAQAWARKKRDSLPGIGVVFTKRLGIVGVDLDDCFERNGRLKEYARDVVQCLNSYTERSPSRTGLHTLVQGEIPHSIKQDEIEIYDEARYFTVTGNVFGADAVDEPDVASVCNDIMPRQDELMAIWVTFGGDLNEPRLPAAPFGAPPEWSERDIANMLAVLPAWGDYNEDWLPVLMAVHSVFPDERGVELCEAWSAGKPGEIRRKFRSFDNTGRDGVTIGTLVHKAKQYGWQPPQRRRTGKRSVWDMWQALADV